MYSNAELYAMAKLSCGIADLDMLDQLYSTLGEELVDVDEHVNDNDSLNDILYYLYEALTSQVADQIREFINVNEEIELQANHVDFKGDVVDSDFFVVDFEDEDLRADLEKLLEDLEGSCPFCNYLDSHIGNELDEVVDWDSSVKDNAIALLQHWADTGEINPSAVEDEDE